MSLKLQLLSVKGAQWVGWCKHRLAGLTNLRMQTKGSILKQVYVLPGNIKAMVISWDVCDIIRIWGGASGFIFHPRSDSFPGGISSADGNPILAVYAYPFVDDDHGSGVLSGDSGSWGYTTDLENYGNLDWIGTDGVIVSWRGPSGRSLPMDSLHNYPGFTIFDYETTGDFPVSHYTLYQYLVYQGGEILFEFPVTSKVLGATDVYVVLGVDYAGRINPDGGMGGFYTEVWRGVAERIGYLSDSRPTVPWFFNLAGSEAVSAGKKLVIAEDGESVDFTAIPTGEGSETKTITSGVSWGLGRTGNFQMYHDYAGDVLANISLLVTGEDSSVLTGSGSTSFSDFPVKYSGVQATSLLITGPDAYGGEGAYTATLQPPGAGDCGDDIEWSYPTAECGMGTVSATKGGLSGAKQVRMASGQWGAVTEIYNDPSAGSQDHITEIVSGGTQTTYVQGSVGNIHTWTTDAYVPFQGDCNNCVFVANNDTNVEKGTGLDYTYWPPSHTNGTPATCCGPGGVGQGGLDYYIRTLRIYSQEWVC